MSVRNDIMKWTKLAETMVNEEAKTAKEKLGDEIKKTDSKIMDTKIEKLNQIVKMKYYDKDAEMEDEKMFQFKFDDRGSHYEFSMPINILFGAATRKYCAKFWDNFFEEADIRTSFADNIDDALKQAGGIMLTMKLNKALTKEVEPMEGKEA